ncbi:hypothetical protein D3C80_1609790 [compost metagenome]
MLPHNPFGDKAAQPGGIAVAFFQCVKNLRPLVHTLRMQRVFFVHTGIYVPAVISKTDMVTRQRHIQQPDHRIRQLIAEIIHIVMHLNAVPGFSQNTHQCIPDTRVSEMSYMHRFVWIHAGMLNDNFFPCCPGQFKAASGPLLPVDI